MRLKVNLYFDKEESTEDLMRLIEVAFNHLRKDVEEGKISAFGKIASGHIIVSNEINKVDPE